MKGKCQIKQTGLKKTGMMKNISMKELDEILKGNHVSESDDTDVFVHGFNRTASGDLAKAKDDICAGFFDGGLSKDKYSSVFSTMKLLDNNKGDSGYSKDVFDYIYKGMMDSGNIQGNVIVAIPKEIINKDGNLFFGRIDRKTLISRIGKDKLYDNRGNQNDVMCSLDMLGGLDKIPPQFIVGIMIFDSENPESQKIEDRKGSFYVNPNYYAYDSKNVKNLRDRISSAANSCPDGQKMFFGVKDYEESAFKIGMGLAKRGGYEHVYTTNPHYQDIKTQEGLNDLKSMLTDDGNEM